MKLTELFESYLPTINPTMILEGIDHPEDLIITNGAQGAERVVRELIGLEKDPSTISVKWDGFPAVVFGRDGQGALVFVDKHMYDKVAKGKMEFTTIKDYDEGRGANRADLWKKEDVLRPLLERIVPAVRDKYWMGDLMWVGKLDAKDGVYSFKPNTVTYEVKQGSQLGEEIARSQGGIAVHTLIPGLGKGDTPLKGLEGLPEGQGIVFLTGEIKDNKPKVSVDRKFLKDAQKTISKYSGAADKFISDLTAMKAKMVLTAMGPFITSMLEEGDIKTDIVPRFLDFLGDRLSDAAAEKLLGKDQDGWLYQADGGGPGLLAIWELWAAVTDLKIHVKRQLDDQTKGGAVRAVIDGEDSHEGYVFGAGKDKLKIVDRLGFSAANFARHRVAPEEIAAREKMPMAAFCFGRMNPPTRGHEKLMDATLAAGGKNSFIFLSNSVSPEKDPLDPVTKAAFISKIYPKFASHIVREPVLNPIYAANWLYAKGFRHMTFIAGSDRLGKSKGSIEKLLNSWNSGPVRSNDNQFGEGGREHVLLKFVSSGERDADSEGVEGYSGSKARAAAAAGDEKQFQIYTGVGPNITVSGKNLYQATRDAMGVSDKSEPTKATASTAKIPAAKAAKAPAKQEVAETILTELRSLADGGYGGWINARGGAVYPLGPDDMSHKDTAADLGIDMENETDYLPAYEKNLVRYITQDFPGYFELSGRYEDLKRTFKIWWPTAIKANHVYIDMLKGREDVSKGYEPANPASRSELRRDFGPVDESEGLA